MTDLQKSIEATIGEIVHLDTVKDQLATTRAELDQAIKEQKSLDRKLDKELRDVERLEGLSTKAIFYKILGSKEEQIEKERQQYLESVLRNEELQNRIQILEYEVNLLEAKLSSRVKLDKKLAKLKQLREEEILRSDPVLRAKLLEVSNQLEENYHLKKELQEAIEVGRICHNLTKQVVKHLTQVRNWGVWGKQKGYTRMMRRDSIDRARNLSFQVKHHLNLLNKELADMGQRVKIDIDTSTFIDFTDFFFDNLITDWIMHQKISKALESANHAKKNLQYVLTKLESQYKSTDTAIVKLNSKREKLIMS